MLTGPVVTLHPAIQLESRLHLCTDGNSILITSLFVRAVLCAVWRLVYWVAMCVWLPLCDWIDMLWAPGTSCLFGGVSGMGCWRKEALCSITHAPFLASCASGQSAGVVRARTERTACAQEPSKCLNSSQASFEKHHPGARVLETS